MHNSSLLTDLYITKDASSIQKSEGKIMKDDCKEAKDH